MELVASPLHKPESAARDGTYRGSNCGASLQCHSCLMGEVPAVG